MIDPLSAISLLATIGDGGPPWPWFPLIPLLFLGLWVGAFVVFGRRCRDNYGRQRGESALAERFARGEIEETEYRSRLGVLRSKP